MPENQDYKEFCKEIYMQTYETTYPIELGDRTSDAAKQSARLSAQRKAIDKALVEGLLRFSPHISESEIWEAIGITHKINVANLGDFNIAEEHQESVIKRSLSAHQSWIKSSGHSFERYISNIDSDDLQRNEVRFILQSELTKMIKENRLANTTEDIAGLSSWGKDFDLYPTTYVVDKNGNIVGQPIVGAITSSSQAKQLNKLIDQAIENSKK